MTKARRQGAAAHEGQRRHFDHALLHQPPGRVAQHIEQRVIKRAQIGIDLLFQVAGQKAQPLARFQRRARQDQPVDPLFMQHMGGKGGRQIGLAGAGGADAEHQRALAHHLQIGGLGGRARPHRARRRGLDRARRTDRAPSSVKRISASTSARVMLSPASSRAYSARRIAPARSRSLPVDRHQIAAHVDADIQLLLDAGEMLGMRPAQRAQQLVVGKFQGHDRRSSWRSSQTAPCRLLAVRRAIFTSRDLADQRAHRPSTCTGCR